MITRLDVPTPGGPADAVLATPEGDGPWPGVLLFMDAFGLRPQLEQMAERLASHGYAVLVPNVFHRSGRAPLVDLDDLFAPENRARMLERLGPFMAALTPEIAAEDAAAYVDWLRGDPRVASGPLATTGYCMGGALAVRAAAVRPEEVAGVATFHAGRLATDAPASPHTLFPRLRAELYLAHADNDGSMPPEQQELVAHALTDADVAFIAEQYDGAAHGFTMADTAAYDEAAAERHWDNLLALLDRTVGPAAAAR